jgi:hypothetical protein
MPAPWKRISPALPQAGQIQAVQAKKHVTVFQRSPSAPGAGRPEVKAAFSRCAGQTLGIEDRSDRNVKVKQCMEAAGVKTGVYHRKSRARAGSPLFGKVYTYGAGTAG